MKQLLVLGLCAAVAAQMAFGAHSETAGTAASHAPLPVSRAPFEQSAEVARRPVSLASWPFHPPAGSVLLGEQRLATWAEFRSGDKVAVVDGYDGRIHYVGRTGFGKVLFYRGGAETASPLDNVKPDPYGRELLAWLELRFLDGSRPYSRYMECYSNAVITVDETASRVEWERPCRMPDGAMDCARYSVAAAGDGLLALEWTAGTASTVPVEFRLYLCDASTNGLYGVENGTRLYVNRDSETERIEIEFPDGEISGGATSSSPTAAGDPTPHYIWRTEAASGRVLIDLCGSTVPKKMPVEVAYMPSATIDFLATDALDVPTDPMGNLLSNGSFELGLVGWNYWWGGEPWYMVAATGEPLETITDEAKVGDKALRMRRGATRDKYEAIQSTPMSLEPGVPHLLSAWVKRAADETGEAKITMAAEPVVQKFHVVTKPDGGDAKLVVTLADDDWHFVEIPFVSECGDCKIVLDGSGAAAVIDGIRVERGTGNGEQGTGNREPPAIVEARLETSNPNNILAFGAPIDARLVLSGPDGAEGAVRVTLRNFYNETVFDETLPFSLPAGKVLPLNFDAAKLGTGVFILGTEFSLAEGAGAQPPSFASYRSPYQRLAILKPLDGTHPTADFYLQLAWYERSSNAEKLARYARALGIMATNWRSNGTFADTNAPETRLRMEYGFVNRLHALSSELMVKYPDRFGHHNPENLSSFTNVVPEKVAFVEQEAYEAGLKAAPDDNWWTLWNEEDAVFPMLLRALREEKDPARKREAFETWFQYQHACWKGLKRAFDERGIKLMFAPTHGNCHYNEEWRREMIDLFLDVAASHGFRYDFVAIHTYRALDGSFLGPHDRDANAALLLRHLADRGYGDAPVMFSEGYNILPFFIPRFGANAFADAYINGGPASLDLGWREFLQAGAMARLYVMDLKYWPRVMNSHSWQHRLVADAAMSPFAWNIVPNTLGHLLPSPELVGDVKRDGWRAYVFRQDGRSVAAVWTNERQAELGRRKGMALQLRLPDGAQFVDLMGNERDAPRPDADGAVSIPLTPAPLFILSADAAGLLNAFRTAE
ncbi:MAG: hypothetical protein IKO40_07275 [Kiritimatiellae bacterium]|nr:hypothetical protein [Kiritimatiellia bacterium]